MHSKGRIILNLKDAKGRKDPYELRVAKILDRHEDGTPRKLELLLNSKTITLEGGEEFMTVFVPCIMLGNEGTG